MHNYVDAMKHCVLFANTVGVAEETIPCQYSSLQAVNNNETVT